MTSFRRTGLVALVFAAWAGAASAEVRAVVVGINDYVAAEDLRGAVNDANRITDALRRAGVTDVVTLVDGAASAAGFEQAWSDALERSEPGDVLLLTFSGHGIRVPEVGQRTTLDGFQKGFLLQPYDQSKAPGEILRDEDLYDRFAAATAREIKVVFVADACYSGAAVRGSDERGARGSLRFQRFDTDAAPLAEFAASEIIARPTNPGVSVFSATVEQKSILEIVVDQQYHGALSYAFSEGLVRAGREGAPEITVGMLKDYISPQVVMLSNKRQIPQFAIPQPDLGLFPNPARHSEQLELLPSVSVAIRGNETPSVGIEGMVLADAESAAELVWQSRTGHLIDSNGDVLATEIGVERLQPAIAARRVVRAVQDFVAEQTHRIDPVVGGRENPSGDQFFTTGSLVEIELDTSGFRYAALIDLTGSGTVQLVWPLSSLGDPEDGSVSGPLSLSVPVTDPFGADYIITVLSQTPLLNFNRQVAASHNTAAPGALYNLLKSALASGAQLGIDVLFSCNQLEGSGRCDFGQ